MAVEYRADLVDTSGNVIAQFKAFMSLTFDLRLNDKGNYQLTISGYDDRWMLFQPDYLIHVWMRDPEELIPWTRVFVGIHKTAVKSLETDGGRTWASYGPTAEELLDKENILWPSGSTQAEKSGVVSTVMRAFVLENVGAGALAASGRDLDGVVAGLSLSLDPLIGPAWEGARARKSLLGTLKDLALYSAQMGDPVDFWVTSGAGFSWVFNTGRFGLDLTTVGLNPATGLNTAGNVPVVFSEARGNILSYTRSLSRYNTASTIIALGQGLGAARSIYVAEDAAEIAVSPIARRTRTINASNNAGAALLAAVANAELRQAAPAEKFDFVPRKSGQIPWRDYNLGDYITAEDAGDVFHKRLTGIRVTVSARQVEDIAIAYQDF